VKNFTAPPAHPSTREQRGLELYRTRGPEIRQASPGQDLYLVPSCTGRGFYSVDYREETCDCPDFTHRRENCKHILALAIAIAKGSIAHPELAAGDPFVAAAKNRPHACMDGWVFLGRVVESQHDLDGEVVVYDRVPCRRCAGRGA
jgi:SWIM zinc finger